MTDSRSWPWWRWVLTGLSLVALALSVYLELASSGKQVGDRLPRGQRVRAWVLNSRWSTVAGVLPISSLAAGAYCMLVASLSIGPATAAPVRRLAWGAMLVLVGAAAGSARVVHHPPEMGDWGLLSVLCSRTHHRSAAGGFSHPARVWRVMGRLSTIGLSLVGLVFAGGLAACQVIVTPPPVYLAGQSQGACLPSTAAPGPTVGSPDAPHVVTLLFDYTCPHCQRIQLSCSMRWSAGMGASWLLQHARRRWTDSATPISPGM